VVLVFSMGALPSAAQDSGRSVIDSAQKTILQKDRQKAALLLRESIKTFPPSQKARLVEALSQISTVFISDKGQKAFESGQSLMFDNPDLARARLQEALGLEDKNILVLKALARLAMFRGDCASARGPIQESLEINPFDLDTQILELRTHACLEEWAQVSTKSKALLTLGSLSRAQQVHVHFILSMESLAQKNFKRAEDWARRTVLAADRFPEGHRQLWLAQGENRLNDLSALRRYVSLCKALTVNERKRWLLEPQLCAHRTEAEAQVGTD
jgi:hypothetical protein